MDSSFSDLEFFDFTNSSDEEIKEIQAILRGPHSDAGLELPWEIPAKNKYSGDLQKTESKVSETEPESQKTAKSVNEPAPETLDYPPLQTVGPLPPPAVQTFATIPTTVGPYQSAPYLVSPRTLPYLRTYPPIPFFACPLPQPGDSHAYGQFVPMATDEVDPNPKRQSGRKYLKKRGSEGQEHLNAAGCSTSVPIVPLPVPPSTFVGGNLPLHGYPPGMHSSPTMYYLPVFNHPYGGYLPPSGHMMVPVNVPQDLKCPMSAEVKEVPQSDNVEGTLDSHAEENGKYSNEADICSNLPSPSVGDDPQMILAEDNRAPQSGNRTPSSANNGGDSHLFVAEDDRLQTDNQKSEDKQMPHSGIFDPTSANNSADAQLFVAEDNRALQTDNPIQSAPTDIEGGLGSPVAKNNESLQTENEEKLPSVSGEATPLVSEEMTPSVQSDEVQPTTAKTPQKSDTLPPTNCFQETKKCLPETVPCKDVSVERIKETPKRPSRCWADLFKGEVNGYVAVPPRPVPIKKSTDTKRDIANGKTYSSVPVSNSHH